MTVPANLLQFDLVTPWNTHKVEMKRILFASLLLTILLLHEAVGGPAHSLAMVMAARGAKIPRTIRAPFRNTEMMTARGFGKRSQEMYPYNGELICDKVLYHRLIIITFYRAECV